ncbi:unnamed protein product, partial [Polarella glacialis]
SVLLVAIAKTGNDPRYDIPLDTAIPVIGGSAASHLLAYSANGQGDSATGTSVPLVDRHVPVQGPVAVNFQDTNYQHGKVGGQATITRASSESDVTDYALYWGTSANNSLLYIAILPKATSPLAYTFASGADFPATATHLLAFTMNADGIQNSRPAAVAVHDRGLPEEPAISVQFVDGDMGVGEISGIVTIERAVDEALITYYAVYYAQGPSGPLGSFVGSVAANGQNVTVLIPADTRPPVGYGYLHVRTANADGFMATGVSCPIVDRIVPTHTATSIDFYDQNVVLDQLGGLITVSPASDETLITRYGIYFADVWKQALVLIVELPQGMAELNYTLPSMTRPAGAQYLLVLTGSADGFMANGLTALIEDRAVPQE